MHLRLKIESDGSKPYINQLRREFACAPGGRTVIGRLPDCDVHLEEVTVSRKHAAIIESHGGYHIEDLGSRCGIAVNEMRIQKSAELHEGDLIRIGIVVLRLEMSNANLIVENHNGVAYVAIRTAFFDQLDTADYEATSSVDLTTELQRVDPGLPKNAVLDISRAGRLNTQKSALVWALIGRLQAPQHRLAVLGARGFTEFWQIYGPQAPRPFENLMTAEAFVRGEAPSSAEST